MEGGRQRRVDTEHDPELCSAWWQRHNIPAGYIVVFDHSAGTGSETVSISGSGNVSPTSVTFNNLTKAYLLQGPHGIAGSATLAVNGGGLVTIANSNGYTGGTTSTNGVLNVTAASALGTGPESGQRRRLEVANSAALGGGAPTITGGTLSNTSGAPMTLAGNEQIWGCAFACGRRQPANRAAARVYDECPVRRLR